MVGTLLFNLPQFVDDYAVMSPDGSRAIDTMGQLGASQVYQVFYSGVLYYVASYGIPFLAIIVMSARLAIALQPMKHDEENLTTSGAHNVDSEENQMSKTIAVVAVVSILCQIHNVLLRTAQAALDVNELRCGTSYFVYSSFVSLFVVVDASIHIVIYCIFDTPFRRRLRRRLLRWERSLHHRSTSIHPHHVAVGKMAGHEKAIEMVKTPEIETTRTG